MPDVVADARRMIEGRLRELEAEASRLRGALASLGGDRPRSTRARRRPAASGRRRSGTRKRAPRGQREAEFLAAVEKSPGAKVSAIAEEMGVPPNQVYGLARRLHRAGRIRKRRGGGYALKA
jgi:predicted Rossmann fold nucleotide-binding protein DprA/Smf involved in DNA uptake